MRPIRPVLLALLAPSLAAQLPADLRAAYDVSSYHLELEVEPRTTTLSGRVTVEAVATHSGLGELHLDLVDVLGVEAVMAGGEELDFEHADDLLRVQLKEELKEGEAFAVSVSYSGQPKASGSFSGFHWVETPDGEPWINTSCQGPGAHSWWPCKASFYHPEDKPERVSMDLTVPAGLTGVSNGRLEGVDELEDGRRTFRWVHPYPLETYTVTLNVAPYVVVEDELELPGVDKPVPWIYYVLPGDEEKAALQFAQVPELLEAFSEAFGPWPFPESKFALVQTNFWGMEHSTAVAYGSSFPAWCEANGERDPWASRNRWYDYILVHEVAHEWWGNAVSTDHWGDFWIHEGFGTYAEGVYVEKTQGREAADRWFAENGRGPGRSRNSRLYRGAESNSGEAYSGVIYSKGAAVLNTLRHYVDDDDAWWASLRAFNLAHRYGNASSEDFCAVLEAQTEREWDRFFDEWVYGEGSPRLGGSVAIDGLKIRIAVSNEGSGKTGFHVPLDLVWSEAGERRSLRLEVPPGGLEASVDCDAAPTELAVVNLGRVLGRHGVKVR